MVVGTAERDEIRRRLREAPRDAALTTREASVYLGLSESTLEKQRQFGGGPRFVRATSRAVRYRLRDLDDYQEARRFGSTSEYASSMS